MIYLLPDAYIFFCKRAKKHNCKNRLRISSAYSFFATKNDLTCFLPEGLCSIHSKNIVLQVLPLFLGGYHHEPICIKRNSNSVRRQ